MRQLGVGFNLFSTEREDMFPPAGYGTPNNTGQWHGIPGFTGTSAQKLPIRFDHRPYATDYCPKI